MSKFISGLIDDITSLVGYAVQGFGGIAAELYPSCYAYLIDGEGLLVGLFKLLSVVLLPGTLLF